MSLFDFLWDMKEKVLFESIYGGIKIKQIGFPDKGISSRAFANVISSFSKKACGYISGKGTMPLAFLA